MSTDNDSKPPDRLPSPSTTAEQVTEPVGAGIWDTPDVGSGDGTRTDVHTSEEVESFLTGQAGFDPRNYEGPPVDSQGAFDYKPNAVHADGLNEQGRDWEPPGHRLVPEYRPDSPAEAAALGQGDLASYAGVDSWENDLAYEHDRVWFGAVGEHQDSPDSVKGPPGDIDESIYVDESISGYGVPEGGLPSDGWKEVALGARNSVATGTDQVTATDEKVSPTESALDAQQYNQGSQIRPHDDEYRGWLHCYEFTQDHAVAKGTATENTQYGEGGIPQIYIPDVKDAIRSGILVYKGQIPMTNTRASDRIEYR